MLLKDSLFLQKPFYMVSSYLLLIPFLTYTARRLHFKLPSPFLYAIISDKYPI